MGYYINPAGESKESWLTRNGVRCVGTPAWKNTPEAHLPVCLMDNGPFTAAGIAYDESEFNAFIGDGTNMRPKSWYMVPASLLEEYLPEGG